MIDTQTVLLITDAMKRLVAPGVGKFIDEDVSRDARLGDAVLAYLDAYDGKFAFLVSIRDQYKQRGSINNRQKAGVLNCMVADIKRMEKEVSATPLDTPTEPIVPKIPNGIYTIEHEDGQYTTLRLKDSFREEYLGEQVAMYLSGSNNETDYAAFAFVRHDKISMFKRYAGSEHVKNELVALLADEEDARAMGVAYARRSGNCFVCNRTLTTPESIAAGIGPVCAGRV